MSYLIPGNHKHLTLNDRLRIQRYLDEGQSFKTIAKILCKNPTTISKEVRLHRNTNTWNKGSSKPRHLCTIPYKYDYDVHFAHHRYEQLRTSSREGINKSRKEIHQMDSIIRPLVAQCQSPYHILVNHPELDISVKTLYNYIDQGILLTRNIDLKRKTKFKPRKTKKAYITDRSVFVNRTYSDFLNLNPDYFLEMDTVVSAKGCSKCILTFFLPDTELFLAYMLERRTEGAVRTVFDRLEQILGHAQFSSMFPVILTDRGSEFGDPDSLEQNQSKEKRSRIFYCDAMCSGQKGEIELVCCTQKFEVFDKMHLDCITWQYNCL